MSREKKERQRLLRRQDYRAQQTGRVLRAITPRSEAEVERFFEQTMKQMDAMPGKPDEKFVVFLRCSNGVVFTYLIYGCVEGFTAAMRDAIEKHREANRPAIEGGAVRGVGNASFTPPDFMVQMMAKGVRVLLTNRLENRPADSRELFGDFGQGGWSDDSMAG